MSEAQVVSNAEAVLEEYLAAEEAYRAAVDAVEDEGREALEAVIEARDSVLAILSKYEERAVGTESFGAFVQFRAELHNLITGLPEDIPDREIFDAISDRFEKRRLRKRDFEWAYEQLNELDRYQARLETEADAAERRRQARRKLEEHLQRLEQHRERAEDLREAADLDLSTSLSPLREPIQRYNETVEAAFERFRREESARNFVRLLRVADRYPLISVEPLPDDVEAYILETPAGDHSITKLLEFSEYSRSKLHHYVDDPSALKRAIATQRTAIERRDATPLLIEWPPPPAETLEWRLRELRPVVDRFAPESAIVALRDLRRLATDRNRYEGLRRVAVVRADLTEAERELIETGALEDRIDRLTAIIDRIETELDRSDG